MVRECDGRKRNRYESEVNRMKYTTQVIVNTNRAYKRYTVIVRQTAKGVVLERSGDSLRSLLNEVTDWTISQLGE